MATRAAKGERKARKTPKKKRPLKVHMRHLEVARGHDGFLRGKPEPVVVLGAFAVSELGVRCVLRTVQRFRLSSAPPCNATASDGPHRVQLTGDSALLLVAAALEDDGGGDHDKLYTGFERIASILVFDTDTPVPAPESLEVATRARMGKAGHAVGLLFDDVVVEHTVVKDTWIGAALASVSAEGARGANVRLPLRAEDGRNDWTLVIDVS
jgi:hypothetical protein